MVRSIRRFVSVCLGIGVAIAWLTPAVEAKEPNPIVQLAKKLDQTVDFPGIDNPQTTLRQALDMLSKQYGVRFSINERAFQIEHEQKNNTAVGAKAPRRGGASVYLVAAEDKPASAKKQAATKKPAPLSPLVEDPQDVGTRLVATKPIPKMSRVRLATVLRTILARIPMVPNIITESNATYVIRRDGIEITTPLFKTTEFYRHDIPTYHTPLVDPLDASSVPEGLNLNRGFKYFPLVQAEFEKRPLAEAFKELADVTECSVILDPRVADKAKPVTAALINLPLDTAVELLANMSGLTVLFRDRGLYVTTKENVDAMEKELGYRGWVPGALERFWDMQRRSQAGGQPGASEAAKSESPDPETMQEDVAKLRAEIAKLREELSRLQPKKNEPKKNEPKKEK